MVPLEDSFKDYKCYYKRNLKWYQSIWYFITGNRNRYKELKGITDITIKEIKED